MTELTEPIRWHLQTTTHLSKDKNYYIVPAFYPRITTNPALEKFIGIDGKLQIYGPAGLLEDTSFLNSAKVWALGKLSSDLAKDVNHIHEEEAKIIGFLPEDSTTYDEYGKGQPLAKLAEAWYMEPRPPEFQNLFLKIMFDKAWVDGLPPKVEPCIDLGETSHTVVLLIKTLRKDLRNLSIILNHFAYRMQESRATMVVQPNAQVDFDAACVAGKVTKIQVLLDKLLILNNKPKLSEKTPAALQFGFSSTYDLQYVAYSDMPDCLCDNESVKPYIFQKGIEKLKVTNPFDSQTVNALLFYLPEIKRKYFSYLVSGRKKDLFAAQESWLQFVDSFVYPGVQVIFDTSETKGEYFLKQMKEFEKVADSVGNILKQGLYQMDPTVVLAPKQRQLLLGMANAEVTTTDDKTFIKALTSEVFSVTTLFDRLLNRVPLLELIKIAISAIVKCTSDNELKQKICKAVLGAMPASEVTAKIIPCLRSSGESLAADHLESLITGRKMDIYSQAKNRYPEKFTKSPAEAMFSAVEFEKVNNLYCSDPLFAASLGRPADNISEELLLWLEEQSSEAICECVLTSYGPVEQIWELIEGMKEDTSDIIDILSKNKAQSIEDQSTTSIDRLLKRFEKMMKALDDDFGGTIVRMLAMAEAQLMLATVVLILHHAKNSFVGSLQKDICNPENPFTEKSMTDMVMNSSLFEDKSFLEMKQTIKDIATLAGLSGDIMDIICGLDALGRQFTPSERKRLFTTPCDDSSFDAGFEKAKYTLEACGVTQGIPNEPTVVGEPAPASPTAAALAAEAGSELDPQCPAPPSGKISNDAVHAFCNEVGKYLEATQLEQDIADHEELGAKLVNLCDPAGVNMFVETLDEEAFKKLAAKGKEELLNDAVQMLQTLDPEKLESMLPPAFCGPCDPAQQGKEPISKSHSPPVALETLTKANKKLYEQINKKFNIDVDSYKQILLGTSDMQQFFTNLAVATTNLELEKMEELGKKFSPDEMADIKDEINARMFDAASKAIPDETADGEPTVTHVAPRLFATLLEATGKDLAIIEDTPEYSVYKYSLLGGQSNLYFIYNYAGDTIQLVDGDIKTGVFSTSSQIKTVLIRGSDILFEHPAPDSSGMPNLVDDTLDPVKAKSSNIGIFADSISSIVPGFNLQWLADNETFKIVIQNHLPTINHLVFETIFVGGTKQDLFKSTVFNKIPLTDREARLMCIEGAGKIPLLDPESILEESDKIRQLLECIVSFFDKPTANQIASIFGAYKLLIKVCIVEELLKNIFMFGFVRLGEILRTEALLKLLLENITTTVETIIGGTGHADLLDYSSKVINGRQMAGETFPIPPGKPPPLPIPSGNMEPIAPLFSGEESLKILVRETTVEVGDILESRIQKIVDPDWKKSFIAIDDPEGVGTIKDRLFDYAVLNVPEYWSPNLFPLEDFKLGEASAGLVGMSYLGPDKKYFGGVEWPIGFLGDHSGVNFDNVNDFIENGGWPARSLNAKIPWSGGLFYQPYLKIRSHIHSFKDFWNTLRSVLVEDSPVKAQEWGQPPSLTDNEWSAIHSKVVSLVNKIPEAMTNSSVTSDPTFRKFFDLLFAPRVFYMDHAERRPFTRLVSSYMHGFGDGEWGDGTPVWSWSGLGSDERNYYYWNRYSSGVPMSQRWHWANRGTVSINLASSGLPTGNGLTPQKLGPQRTASTPALFGLTNIGPKDPTGTQPTPATAFYSEISAFLDDVNLQPSFVTSAPPEAQELQKAKAAAGFWWTLQSKIFGSPASHWFSFDIGMRLNMLFPLEGKTSDYKTFFDLIQQSTTIPQFTKAELINHYHENKMFIWQKNNDEAYFCMPIEDYHEPAKDNYVIKSLLGGYVANSSDKDLTLNHYGKAIDYGFYRFKDEILADLKKKLVNKLFPSNAFLTNVVSVKELAVATTLIYRHYLEQSYPLTKHVLSPVKDQIKSHIAAMAAAIRGDYGYVDERDPTANPPEAEFDAKKFFLLIVQMAANMFDPTWKTRWFLPGPLTPIGILAKSLATKWTEDESAVTGEITAIIEPACPPGLTSSEEETAAAKKDAEEEEAATKEGLLDEACDVKGEQCIDDIELPEVPSIVQEWVLLFPRVSASGYDYTSEGLILGMRFGPSTQYYSDAPPKVLNFGSGPSDMYEYVMANWDAYAAGGPAATPIFFRSPYYHYDNVDELQGLSLEMTDKNGLPYYGILPAPRPPISGWGKGTENEVRAYFHSCPSLQQDWAEFGIQSWGTFADDGTPYNLDPPDHWTEYGLSKNEMFWPAQDGGFYDAPGHAEYAPYYATFPFGEIYFRNAVLRTLDWHHPDSNLWESCHWPGTPNQQRSFEAECGKWSINAVPAAFIGQGVESALWGKQPGLAPANSFYGIKVKTQSKPTGQLIKKLGIMVAPASGVTKLTDTTGPDQDKHFMGTNCGPSILSDIGLDAKS